MTGWIAEIIVGQTSVGETEHRQSSGWTGWINELRGGVD